MSEGKLKSALSKLAKSRPVFHSEADFQHALAWELQRGCPTANVRLEKQVASKGERVHLDLLYQADSEEMALELKYKTRQSKFTHLGEQFFLRNQSAQDIGRHDFIKDVQRLETYVRSHPGSKGFAILLTNDQTYWNESKKSNAIDSEFRIHEGRLLQGSVTWSDGASDGTKAKREMPITLRGKYPIRWSDYSSFGAGASDQFRYVLISIQGSN
jgi:hypothetical protein